MASISADRVPASGSSSQPDNTSTHPYTCNTCQVAFRSAESQKGHMRSDWHRYNLKRRVTSLPPISAEVFSEKVLQAQASSSAAASKAAYEKTCTVCQKPYFSENAYQNHINSQKHKAKAAMGEVKARGDEEASSVVSSTFSLGDPVATDSAKDDIERRVGGVVEDLKNTSLADTEGSDSSTSVTDKAIASGPASGMDVDDGNLPKIPLSRCLFCNYDSPSISLNAVHMERIHGMFIPERNFLLDLDGLIDHLQQKIQYFHECLYCGKLKPSVFGLQTHMRDVGHCKIPFDTEAEQLDIGDYYDFTSTYSDGDSEGEVEGPRARTSGGVKLGARREAAIDADGDEDMEDGDGWETDSYESSLDSADLTAVPLDQRIHQYEKLNQHPHHAHTDPRPHHNRDGWHSHAHKHVHAVFYSDYELHLPSGRVAGHRSLNKYFKQNLHNHPSAEERVQRAIEAAGDSDSEEEENRQLARRHQVRGRALVCRANGGLGMNGVTSEKRKEVRVAEKRSRKVEERERRKFQWGNNKQRNHQKHFRDPLLQ